VDLPELLRAAIDGLSPQAADKCVAVTLEARDGTLVQADGDRIMQVVVNLLDNALRFSPAGSEVHISVETSAAEPGGAEGNGAVTVSVRDHGPGIPEPDLALIWDRFHKADRARQRTDSGTGLGLAIAREIVLAHAGEVSAHNAPDGGALLSFTLPLRQDEPAAEPGQ